MKILSTLRAQAFMLLLLPLLVLAGCSQMQDIFKTKQGSVLMAATELHQLNGVIKDDLAILRKRLKNAPAGKYTEAELQEFHVALQNFNAAHKAFNAAIGKGSGGKARVKSLLGFYNGYAKAKASYLRARPYLKAPDRQLLLIDDNFKRVDKALSEIYVLVGAGSDVDATATVKLFLRTLDLILRAT